jgi:hypothetical protein
MAAGFMAGITEALLIVTPFEVVKIRLQQQKGLAYDKLKYHVSDNMTDTNCESSSVGNAAFAQPLQVELLLTWR